MLREFLDDEAAHGFAADVEVFRHMINEFERIMQQEGVPEETRRRVIHTLIFGTPEHSDTKASIKRGLEDFAAGRVSEHPEFLLEESTIENDFEVPRKRPTAYAVCGDYPAPCNCDDPETHGGH